MPRTIKATLLMFFFTLCAVAVFVTHHVRSHARPPVPRELFAVVGKQLAAFRAADFASAYQQAASGVQQKFSMPQFEAMIRRDYGDITNAQRIEFGFVKINGSTAVVQVFFFGHTDSARSFLYSLIAEGDSWKINGVQQMLSAPPGRPLTGLHI